MVKRCRASLLIALIAIVIAIVMQLRTVTRDATVAQFLSSKNPYNTSTSNNRTGIPSALTETACIVRHVNFLGRHGTRYMSKHHKAVTLVNELSSADLSPTGQQVVVWLRDILEEEGPTPGMLAPRGREELFAIGYRFAEWFNDTLHQAVAENPQTRLLFGSTHKARSIDSMLSFKEGFSRVTGDAVLRDVTTEATAENCAPHAETDAARLRFFDACNAYQNLVPELKAQHSSAFTSLLDSLDVDVIERDLVSELLLPASPLLADAKRVRAITKELYEVCIIDFGAHARKDRICSLFEGRDKLLAALEFGNDLAIHYLKSAGNALAYGMSCLLLEDVLSTMEDHMDGTPSDVLGVFRFAHAETVEPLVALLGVYNTTIPDFEQYAQGGSSACPADQTPWAATGAIIAPMAANVGAYLYDCGGEGWKVRFTHNEKSIRLPPCPDADLCPYDAVKSYFRDTVYPSTGFGSCSTQDWLGVCGGVASCEDKSKKSKKKLTDPNSLVKNM